MLTRCPGQGPWYRVWIAAYERWQPQAWHEVPPAAQALEPAVADCLSAVEAADYVEAFNLAMLAHPRNRWAIAIPVVLRYEGDLMPGQVVDSGRTGSVG